MSHALIVGGTGMLADTSRYLAEKYEKVSLVARNPRQLEVPSKLASNFHYIAMDYANTSQLRHELTRSVKSYGPIQKSVIWIHDTAPAAPLMIAEVVEDGNLPTNLIHVLGSDYANPLSKAENVAKTFQAYSNLDYSQVILGFQIVNESSLWLTNEEISQGVNKIVKNPEALSIIGTVEPWEMKP